MAHQRHHRLTDMQRHFLGFVLEGKREISEAEAEARRDNLALGDLRAPCAVVCVSPYYTGVGYTEKDGLIGECCEYVWNWLERRGYACYCLTNAFDNIQIILPTLANGLCDRDLEELFVALHGRLQLRFGFELFIGIGSVVEKITQIALSASEAMEMLAYKHQYADRGVINIANTVRFKRHSGYGTDIMFERVIGCFQDGDLGKMSVRLNELIESIRRRPNVSGTSIRRTIVELTVSILHVASNADVDVDDVLGNVEPYTWILRQTHTEVLTEWLLDLSAKLLGRMESRQETEEKEVIQQACEYVEAHLQDADLGLQAVSEEVGLSGAYFSQLFKTEKNVGLSSYITERRIARAQELLESGGMRTEDIARQLGYSTASYFGRVFKKTTGMTPNAYRKYRRSLQGEPRQ